MEVTNDNKAFSIWEILSANSYLIPIYQRNYAWEKAEIAQLINDIIEFFDGNAEERSYYLGALVYFKRSDGNFELIDGQQRHTTLILINLVLKHWKNPVISSTVANSNLKFESRRNAQRFVEELYSSTDPFEKSEAYNISGNDNFKAALNIIREELRDKDVAKFAEYFYNYTKLFIVEVPHDTDLNHYFEMMNNRGEQLEKHEIVKALLMGKIRNVEKQGVFAAIWDACSDMTDYIYFNFDENYRKKLFDTNGELKAGIEIFLEKDLYGIVSSREKAPSLSEIIDTHIISTNFPEERKKLNEQYRSVIDFPNFLLQVLRIYKKNKEDSLDDKKLLEAFRSSDISSEQFIDDLLRYRIIFDNYIIKQDLSDADENNQNWGIRKLNSTFDGTVKTIEDDEELVKIQSMLYYSNPSNTNNEWLFKILNEQYYKKNGQDFTSSIFNEIAKERFKINNLSYPEVTVYNLYFIDLLLWKQYKDNIRGQVKMPEDVLLADKIFPRRNQFNTFKFKQLSSKEHLFPQGSVVDIDEKILHGIGNLCLISTGQNSTGNKENPADKRVRFTDDNSSLKRLVMFESFNGTEWKEDEINKHENEIRELLRKYLRKSSTDEEKDHLIHK